MFQETHWFSYDVIDLFTQVQATQLSKTKHGYLTQCTDKLTNEKAVPPVCMTAYQYILTHTHTHTHTHTDTHTDTLRHTYTHTHRHTYTPSPLMVRHTYTHTQTHTHT